MDSAAKPPKTLMRSVMDAFRGSTPDEGIDPEVDSEGQDQCGRRMLRGDSPDEEFVRIAGAENDQSSFQHDVSRNGPIGLGEIRHASATDPMVFPRGRPLTVLPNDPLTALRSTPQYPFRGMGERGMASSSVPDPYHKGDFSVRKSLGDQQNVTVRESRRPKEREKDKEYRRLTLTSNEFTTFPLGNPLKHAVLGRVEHSPVPSVPSPGLGVGGSQRMDQAFQITLVYNGQNVRHQVYESMPIITLMEEAGSIFWPGPCSDCFDAVFSDSGDFGPEWLCLWPTSCLAEFYGVRVCDLRCRTGDYPGLSYPAS